MVSAQHESDSVWKQLSEEGQLSVDIAETKNEIIAITTLAGADEKKLEVYVNNDILTIRGYRISPYASNSLEYIHKECFWGPFSRSIVLPVDVKEDMAKAEYKNGILIVRIPKRSSERKVPINIVD